MLTFMIFFAVSGLCDSLDPRILSLQMVCHFEILRPEVDFDLAIGLILNWIFPIQKRGTLVAKYARMQVTSINRNDDISN